MCHYSLSWAKDEKPDRQEMRWAAQESLKALGMERHQALVVSHRDGQPHVHVIANRVDPESGKAAGLNRSKLKLSKWAEEYERAYLRRRALGQRVRMCGRAAAGGGGATGAEPHRGESQSNGAGAQLESRVVAGRDPGGGRAGRGAGG